MPLTDTRDLQRLAMLRKTLDIARIELARAQLILLETPEGKAVESCKYALSDILASIMESEYIIRNTACEHWDGTGEREPWPGVKVKLYTVVDYDRKEAELWARENAPYMLLLNHSAFEKAAKVNLTGLVATLRKEPRATIARDLSAYLPAPGEPEPEEDDREDIPI